MREKGVIGGFTKCWLALREPYDVRARNPDILTTVIEAVAGRAPISIVDLGCGTGATLRALSPRFPGKQTWRLVDNNIGALGGVQTTGTPRGVQVRTMLLDLVDGLEAALEGPIDIVTLSAFLDLVSPEWLEQLVWSVAARRLPVYAALTYNGRVVLRPINQHDAAVIAAVNRHQLSDKGFGPALGPNAPARAIKLFAAAGYDVLHGASDWSFGPVDQEIQLEIFTAWADAAREISAIPNADLDLWLGARRDAVAADRSRLRIGHVDFVARPGVGR
jgi:hypothetical protein